MTAQASEIIEYRGETFSFSPAPLYQYLEDRKDIKFDMYTTAHWRGYQGYWLLENNKLYLTKIESSNLTLEDIFGTQERVLAEWFTGNLEIGFGDYEFGEWDTYYDNYLWVRIESGIVKERKIIKRLFEEPELSFGKYKSKSVYDLLKGQINQTFNREHLCKEYIQEVINFFSIREYSQKIISPYFEIKPEDKEVIEDVYNNSIQYFLTRNFVAIEKKFYVNVEGKEETEKFSEILERLLSSDFRLIRTLSKNEYQDGGICEHTLLINPDLSYIKWAIKNVDYFHIPPHILEPKRKLKFLKSFNIKRLNSTIFEYEPIIEEVEYLFSPEIVKINRKKFEDEKSLRFEPEFGFYTLNLSNEELLNRFGHFLDDKYEKEIIDVQPKVEYDDYYERETYEDYKGSYAQDYEHLSDQFINDVLEGDPDNYWNID